MRIGDCRRRIVDCPQRTASATIHIDYRCGRVDLHTEEDDREDADTDEKNREVLFDVVTHIFSSRLCVLPFPLETASSPRFLSVASASVCASGRERGLKSLSKEAS